MDNVIEIFKNKDKELYNAVCNGDKASALHWLNKGANPNYLMQHAGWMGTTKDDRRTSLLEAVWRNDKEMVEMLLQHGADPLVRSPMSRGCIRHPERNPIDEAVQFARDTIFSILLNAAKKQSPPSSTPVLALSSPSSSSSSASSSSLSFTSDLDKVIFYCFRTLYFRIVSPQNYPYFDPATGGYANDEEQLKHSINQIINCLLDHGYHFTVNVNNEFDEEDANSALGDIVAYSIKECGNYWCFPANSCWPKLKLLWLLHKSNHANLKSNSSEIPVLPLEIYQKIQDKMVELEPAANFIFDYSDNKQKELMNGEIAENIK